MFLCFIKSKCVPLWHDICILIYVKPIYLEENGL